MKLWNLLIILLYAHVVRTRIAVGHRCRSAARVCAARIGSPSEAVGVKPVHEALKNPLLNVTELDAAGLAFDEPLTKGFVEVLRQRTDKTPWYVKGSSFGSDVDLEQLRRVKLMRSWTELAYTGPVDAVAAVLELSLML